MKRDLLASNRVRISTTEGSKTTDQYAKDAEGKVGKGGSVCGFSSPPLFLCPARSSRKLPEVDKVTQKDFYFLMTLTEIESGAGVWFAES